MRQGDSGECPSVCGALAVQTAQDVNLDGVVVEIRRDDHEGRHVDVIHAGLALQRHFICQFNPERPDHDFSSRTSRAAHTACRRWAATLDRTVES